MNGRGTGDWNDTVMEQKSENQLWLLLEATNCNTDFEGCCISV